MTYQYDKINFQDLVVSDPHRYTVEDVEVGTPKVFIIKEKFGTISQQGTKVNAENLNHMEEGIADAIDGVNECLNTCSTLIDDENSSTTKVYSSSKIESILGDIETLLSNI